MESSRMGFSLVLSSQLTRSSFKFASLQFRVFDQALTRVSSLPREIHDRVFPSLSFNSLALSFTSQDKRPEKHHNRSYIRATFVEAGHSGEV